MLCFICFRDLHATDGDGKTCLHHASSSKAHIAQNVVSAIIAGGPNLGTICFSILRSVLSVLNKNCMRAGKHMLELEGFLQCWWAVLTKSGNSSRQTRFNRKFYSTPINDKYHHRLNT